MEKKNIFKNIVDTIKKDPKKGIVLLLPIMLIIFGVWVWKSKSEITDDNLVNNQESFNAIPLPDIDSEDLSEGDKKANLYEMDSKKEKNDSMLIINSQEKNRDYFSSNGNSGISNVLGDEEEDSEREKSFDNVFGSGTVSSTNSNKNNNRNKNNSVQVKEEKVTIVVPVNTIPEKRRRVPSDGYGNMNENADKGNSEINNFTISAVVSNSDQPVKSGSTIRLRITEDCKIGGLDIKRNTRISGICTFTKERVKISLKSVRLNGQLINTDYQVYEMDGIEGVYVPGGIKSEIVKDGADESLNESGTKVTTPLGTFGVSSLKKAAGDPSVLIKDGHKIILKYIGKL